jgi:hypothetical protein
MNKKKAALIALSLALLTGCSSQQEQVEEIKYKSLEDMWINSPRTFQETKTEWEYIKTTISNRPSADKITVKFIIDTNDIPYGNMLCHIYAFENEEFSARDYIEIEPHSEIEQYTITIDMLEGYSSNRSDMAWTSCMLHPVK